MTVDPASAATQAASLASVAKQGFLAEQHKLAQLQMVQAATVSGELTKGAQGAAKRATLEPAASSSFTPEPFSSEFAQRLSAVNGAAQRAQAAAVQALGHDALRGGSQMLRTRAAGTLSDSSFMASQMALPTRTTRNGLALDYFHLGGLPAAARLGRRGDGGAGAAGAGRAGRRPTYSAALPLRRRQSPHSPPTSRRTLPHPFVF